MTQPTKHEKQMERTMTNEKKTPQADEYWFPARGKPFLCIAANDRGDTVWKDWVDTYYLYGDDCMWKHWHHEPRCTGFDWTKPPAIDPGDGWEVLPVGTVLQEGDEYLCVGNWRKTDQAGERIGGSTAKHYLRRKPPAEVWPKYVVNPDESCRWYIKRISANSSQHFSGTEIESPERWGLYQDSLVESGAWIEVTEAEALARVKPAEPAAAESPDDWVDLPETHILRADIDEVSETGDCWWPVMLSEALMLGESGWTKARCRRRDLPAPQQKRIPVRLWCLKNSVQNVGSGVIACVDNPDSGCDLWQEIKYGSDGFYVEGGE